MIRLEADPRQVPSMAVGADPAAADPAAAAAAADPAAAAAAAPASASSASASACAPCAADGRNGTWKGPASAATSVAALQLLRQQLLSLIHQLLIEWIRLTLAVAVELPRKPLRSVCGSHGCNRFGGRPAAAARPAASIATEPCSPTPGRPAKLAAAAAEAAAEAAVDALVEAPPGAPVGTASFASFSVPPAPGKSGTGGIEAGWTLPLAEGSGRKSHEVLLLLHPLLLCPPLRGCCISKLWLGFDSRRRLLAGMSPSSSGSKPSKNAQTSSKVTSPEAWSVPSSSISPNIAPAFTQPKIHYTDRTCRRPRPIRAASLPRVMRDKRTEAALVLL